ncbi:hypothetical protein AVEN_96194-1 [Araneus ventricosus]|uniref:Reverse transcriptase RNase H-like domain-containing protein n=1 Tax=Araneus ventricosus TaxID=182803 RepID=A0A4Y2FQR5_ARAVE|nr:hypothetical protein AVEN_96194-1 [Araneus ventricosus]
MSVLPTDTKDTVQVVGDLIPVQVVEKGPTFTISNLALHVDASDFAIGGALHQILDSGLQKLTTEESSYSTYDHELLAAYSTIRHIRDMLEARQFTVFTDHKPLTYAFRQKNDQCSPSQMHQMDFISQFTTNIAHIPGPENVTADIMSRVSAFTFPSKIDYVAIAEAQNTNQDLSTLMASQSSYGLRKCLFLNPGLELCVTFKQVQHGLLFQ